MLRLSVEWACQKAGPSFLGLELLHLLGEDPQRPIESHAPVNAADLASADAPPLGAAAKQTTLQAVLLHPLEGKPEALAATGAAVPVVPAAGRRRCHAPRRLGRSLFGKV